MEDKPSPLFLVMLPYREVKCDDTLHEYIQVLRFDLIDMPNHPLQTQLLLDRRHKFNKGMSRPVAYFRMSRTEQLLKLSNTALAIALTLVFTEHGMEPTDDQIHSALKSHWAMAEIDVINAVKSICRDLKLHRMVPFAKEG